MRIALFADALDYQSAGIFQYLSRLVHALDSHKTRHEYILIKRLRSESLLNLEQVLIPCKNFSYINRYRRYTRDFPKWVKSNNIDVVVEFTHFGPFRMPERVRTVSVIHDLTAITHPRFHPLSSSIFQSAFMRRILTRTHLIVANSNYTKSTIVNHFAINPEKLAVQYPIIAEKVDGIRSLKPILDSKYLLHVGTIEPRKNIESLLRMFEIFQLDNPDYKLVLTGKIGWKSADLLKMIAHSKITESIIVTDYVSKQDLNRWFDYSEVCLFSSHIEGFGMPIAEAIARGKKLVVHEHPSMDEACGNGAMRVDVNNPVKFAKMVKEIIDSENFTIHSDHLALFAESVLVENWEYIMEYSLEIANR